MHIPVPRSNVRPTVCKLAPTLISLTLVMGLSVSAGSQGLTSVPSPMTERERMHQSDQWHEIQKHLPDPATASPQSLEQQADILRARRFP